MKNFKEIFTEEVRKPRRPRRPVKGAKRKSRAPKKETPKIVIEGQEFTILTNTMIIKGAKKQDQVSGLARYTRDAVNNSKGNLGTRNLSDYVKEPTNNLSKKGIRELQDALKITFEKLYKSKPLKTALLAAKKEELEEDGYETFEIMNIIEKGTLDDIIALDLFRMDINTSHDSFNSIYGSHNSSETTGKFYFAGKDREVRLGSSMSGTSW